MRGKGISEGSHHPRSIKGCCWKTKIIFPSTSRSQQGRGEERRGEPALSSLFLSPPHSFSLGSSHSNNFHSHSHSHCLLEMCSGAAALSGWSCDAAVPHHFLLSAMLRSPPRPAPASFRSPFSLTPHPHACQPPLHSLCASSAFVYATAPASLSLVYPSSSLLSNLVQWRRSTHCRRKAKSSLLIEALAGDGRTTVFNYASRGCVWGTGPSWGQQQRKVVRRAEIEPSKDRSVVLEESKRLLAMQKELLNQVLVFAPDLYLLCNLMYLNFSDDFARKQCHTE